MLAFGESNNYEKNNNNDDEYLSATSYVMIQPWMQPPQLQPKLALEQGGDEQLTLAVENNKIVD